MTKIDHQLQEHIAVVTFNDGENRFNPPFLESLLGVLDHIENQSEATTLVLTAAHEKIFSNGIDLEWLVPLIKAGELATAKAFFYLLNRTFVRILTYPLITIAAISGHAFAGGAILSCAFDFRFMRSDRGYFCLPEVDLGIPFLPGMNALLKKAMPMYMIEEMQFTGIRLTAEQCQAHHIIRKACHQDDLMSEALAFANSIKKRRTVVAEMKARLYRPVIDTIALQDAAYIESGRFNIG